MTLAPGTKLGPYEILGPLGAGGMGEVYRARDTRLGREVAVKVLPASFAADPDRLRRFEQEARATSQLNHPNILAVFDTGTHDGAPYVVEELLEGTTLRERIGGTPLAPRKTIDYARQTAQGLAAAHAKGIVHRDLKPENLFITSDGRVKILDFGLAKLMPPESSHSAMTDLPTRAETGAGVVVGTVGYMSPEQVRGQATDHRSDIFSFGSILYEMVTGRRAFAAASSVETMNAILKEEPPEISRVSQEIPPGLERIVQHCLEKSPDERFQSARDLAFQLEALSSISTAAVGARGAAAAATRRSVVPAWVAVALAGAALIGVPAAWWAGGRTRPPLTDVHYRQITFRQGIVSSARFTPDGESVLYAASWDGLPAEIFMSRPGSPESRSLGLPSAEILSVSSKGEMALLVDSRYTIGWQRQGTLALASLSGGVPRPIVADVQAADWAPDGQALAIVRYVDGRCRLEYPQGKVLYETSAWISSVRFSRDGQRIAFLDHPGAGDDRGYPAVVDLQGKVTKLTEPNSSTAGITWSPDGSEIWYSGGKEGNVRAIYAVDLAGRVRLVDGAPASLTLGDVTATGRVLLSRDTARRGIIGLAPGEPAERDLSWLDWSRPGDLSRDGRWLLFEEQGQGGGADYALYLRGTDGAPAVRLGSGTATALSPDGKWAAAIRLADPHKVTLYPRGVGEPRILTFPTMEIISFSWLHGEDRLLLVGVEPGRLPRLYVIDSEGATPRPVAPEGTGFIHAVTTDGAWVAAPGAGQPLMLYPTGAGEPRPIPGANSEDRPIAFSRDGTSLLVGVREGITGRIDRIDLATGQRALWHRLAPPDRAGLVDVGFILAAPEAEAYVYSYRRVLSTLYLVEGLQ